MPDTEMISSEPEPTLDEVGLEFPDWHCYAPGINGIVFASLRGSCPASPRARTRPRDPARGDPLLDGRPWTMK